jgi:AhpD family alkylhydroperoxidase
MSTMQNYPEHRRDLMRLVKELGQDIPDTMTGFQALHKGTIKDGALDATTKELIALSIAVAVRCDGCIAYHVYDALKAGATREQIAEAIGVSVLMGGGPALMYAAEAMEAVDQYNAEGIPA